MNAFTRDVEASVARANNAGPVCRAVYEAVLAANGTDLEAQRAAAWTLVGWYGAPASCLSRAAIEGHREFVRWVGLSDRGRSAVLDPGVTWEQFLWSCYAGEVLRVCDEAMSNVAAPVVATPPAPTPSPSAWQRLVRWFSGG